MLPAQGEEVRALVARRRAVVQRVEILPAHEVRRTVQVADPVAVGVAALRPVPAHDRVPGSPSRQAHGSRKRCRRIPSGCKVAGITGFPGCFSQRTRSGLEARHCACTKPPAAGRAIPV